MGLFQGGLGPASIPARDGVAGAGARASGRSGRWLLRQAGDAAHIGLPLAQAGEVATGLGLQGGELLLAQAQALFKLAQGGGLLLDLVVNACSDLFFGFLHLLLQVSKEAFAHSGDDFRVSLFELVARLLAASLALLGTIGFSRPIQQMDNQGNGSNEDADMPGQFGQEFRDGT